MRGYNSTSSCYFRPIELKNVIGIPSHVALSVLVQREQKTFKINPIYHKTTFGFSKINKRVPVHTEQKLPRQISITKPEVSTS
jgi:hypothetical protein